MSQDPAPTHGMLRFTRLPMAENRTEAYRIVRDAGPIIKSPRGFVLSSSEYVEYALKHPELFSSKQAFDLVGSPLPMVPIAFDPPEHTRYRHILQPFLGPRETAAWQPRVRSLVGTLIDSFVERGHCDLVAELAVPLPAEVFLTLFGLPMEDRDRLIAWKEGLLGSPMLSGGKPTEETIRVGGELFSYLVGHIDKRRRHLDGAGDLLGRLLADTSEERMSDEELLGLSFLFVLAGLDTVTSALSTAFTALAMQPRLRQQIAADPSVIPEAVEELLRADGPVVFLPRVASQDIELGGQILPAGSEIQLAIAVANRDPAEHADPDQIDLRRRERHYAFGGGPHRCLGVHLARMEMREVLAEWHSRIPEYELAPAFTPRVEWPTGLVGLDALPLVFPPGAAAAA
ncbi:MAG TPA: cytochrome P450 [Streptosporangiaceae bacterium]|nr:cytochrome P450 [Streptosporangiaceae bacterium]